MSEEKTDEKSIYGGGRISDLSELEEINTNGGSFVAHGNEDEGVRILEFPSVESATSEYVDGDINEEELEAKLEAALKNESYDPQNDE